MRICILSFMHLALVFFGLGSGGAVLAPSRAICPGRSARRRCGVQRSWKSGAPRSTGRATTGRPYCWPGRCSRSGKRRAVWAVGPPRCWGALVLGVVSERQLAAGHDPLNLAGLAMAGANPRDVSARPPGRSPSRGPAGPHAAARRRSGREHSPGPLSRPSGSASSGAASGRCASAGSGGGSPPRR